MGCDGRDNTKNLWSFISIVVPSKKYDWSFWFFKNNNNTNNDYKNNFKNL